uniref:tRNA(Ile)-lysidine synthase n=1 Tax=Callithamnion tetricum TaxID=193179 RepID=A0A4D6WN61_9FLOR|nr:tRNA Ile-lysidine synthetase [Callithamnion tetricum]
MKDNIIHKFNKNINNIHSLYNVKHALVALSGGSDSICLMKLLHNYNRLHIDYIYIDHQWSHDSYKHIEHLINQIKYYGLNIAIYQIKNITYSETNTRKIRYKIILHHATKYKYQAIITGHNNTDKIETFIQQIIRGTSINGATSLTFMNKIKKFFFRPLIHITKTDLIWLCRYFCLPIWSDYTNYNYSIQRNRIRYELLPYLRNYLSHSIEKQIISFLTLSNIDNEYLKQNTLKLYLTSHHKSYVALNHIFIQKQHISLQTRILQLFFYHNFQIILKPKNIWYLISLIKNKLKNTQIVKYYNISIHITQYWLYIL